MYDQIRQIYFYLVLILQEMNENICFCCLLLRQFGIFMIIV